MKYKRIIAILIVLFQLSSGISYAKHINLVKIPREKIIKNDDTGLCWIFQDSATLLDGFFGIGRYSAPDPDLCDKENLVVLGCYSYKTMAEEYIKNIPSMLSWKMAYFMKQTTWIENRITPEDIEKMEQEKLMREIDEQTAI